MKAYLFDEQGYFNGEIECQKDPLESKIKGYDVFLQPSSSTDLKPLEDKEGYRQKFVDGSWEYEELPPTIKEELFSETEKGKLIASLQAKQGQIQQLDYIGVKIATGRATVDDYKDEIELMNMIAEEINEIKEKIKKIDDEEKSSVEE